MACGWATWWRPRELIRELRALRRLVMRHVPTNNQQAAAELHCARPPGSLRAAPEPGLPRARRSAARGAGAPCTGSDGRVGARRLGAVDACRAAPHRHPRAGVRLYRQGVVVEPGDVFFAAMPRQRSHLRIGYSSIPVDRIDAGVRVIARELAAMGARVRAKVAAAAMFDILIRGGELIDGSGATALRRRCRRARRAHRSHRRPAQRQRRADDRRARPHVAPGFIDMHTHSDFTLLVDGRADSQVCQGVTTEVIGQCGFSAAPMGAAARSEPAHRPPRCRRGARLARLRRVPRPAAGRAAGAQRAAFVGHGALRRCRRARDGGLRRGWCVWPSRPSTKARPGCPPGWSTGPATRRPRRDRRAGRTWRRGAAASTQRMCATATSIARPGFAEAIRTARRAGARLQISHIQPKFGAPPGAMASALEAIERAERRRHATWRST